MKKNYILLEGVELWKEHGLGREAAAARPWFFLRGIPAPASGLVCGVGTRSTYLYSNLLP